MQNNTNEELENTENKTGKQEQKNSGKKDSKDDKNALTNMDAGFNVRDFLDVTNMSKEEIDRCEFWVSANREVRKSGKHNFNGTRIPVNSQWNLEKMEEMLEGYHDTKLIDYLRFSWPLNVQDTCINEEMPENQEGVRNHPQEIEQYLKKEIESSSIIGPFLHNLFGPEARFSPLDTRPKKDTDELRVILNLSYPYKGNSMNSSINKEVYAENEDIDLRYPTVEDLAKIVRKKGTGSKIFIWDLSKAYRQLYMCPADILYLGYMFNGRIYFDVPLSMGSSSSAFCCQRMTNAITYIYNEFSYEDVNYLDDLGAAESAEKAEEAYDCLGWLLDVIGIKESKGKAKPPAVICIFLGILFNTLTMTLQITPDRMKEILLILEEWMTKKYYNLKDLQCLLGKLNFVASTVRSGRVFVSRIINELKKFKGKNVRRKVTEQLKADVNWWKVFMREFDGISIMPPIKWDAPDKIFSSDACLSGCGGWSDGEAFHCKFPKKIRSKLKLHINELELLAIIITIKKFASRIENRNLLAYCDNQTSVEIVNSGAAKNQFAQGCLWEICYLLAHQNAMIKMVHLSSAENRI